MELGIHENIRKYRKAFGLTQEQLAEAVGVTVGAVSKWESGLSNPDIGMLPVLADFFELSVDVLLGYQSNCRTAEAAAQKIHELLSDKNYEEGEAEAKKALQRFPNRFDLVYQCAELFHLKGVEREENAALYKSLELYQRACGLISQNTDPDRSELSIQISIGEIYISLGDIDRALAQLKKYNSCGVNDGMIGYLLVYQEKNEEAVSYLSKSLLKDVVGLFRTTIGLSEYYINQKDNKSALDVVLWMLQIIEGLKYPDKISYLDKAEVILLFICAQIAADTGENEKAEEYLRNAIHLALVYDSSPEYDLFNIKYYSGEKCSIGDDFGETAMDGIKKNLESDKTASVLNELWRRIINEDK